MVFYNNNLIFFLPRALKVLRTCLLLIPAFLNAEGYHLTLTQWWEHSPDSKPVNKCEAHKGLPLLRGQTAVLPSGSIMELEGLKGEVFRLGSNTQLTLLHDRQFRLSLGSAIVYIPPISEPLRIQGPTTDFWLHGEGTLALQVTSNLGMKIICLSHEPQLEIAGHSSGLVPSNVYFLPPNVPRIGRSITIDLSLFLRTSKLIQDLKGVLPSDTLMRKTAFRQAINIRSRTNLFVGDATSPKDFDLIVVD